jgi:hypothetical protein
MIMEVSSEGGDFREDARSASPVRRRIAIIFGVRSIAWLSISGRSAI